MILLEGLSELQQQLQRIADKSEMQTTAERALKAGAKPMHQQMKANASSDPQIRSGLLHRSIATGGVKKRGARSSVSIGVHGRARAYYKNPVEFGHGGPAPAPPHPFVRPAFDKRADDAYMAMRDALEEALFGE